MNRTDFEIARDVEEDEENQQMQHQVAKTFYKPDKPSLVSRSSSNLTQDEAKDKKYNAKANKEFDYQPKDNSSKTKLPVRNSDASSAQVNESDELKFILSHSNTLLTSELPDDNRQNNDNIVDIDEDSNEAYEDMDEHLFSIEKKLDQVQDHLNAESKERKADIDMLNDKLDKILALLSYQRNEPDFTKYRTNTFINTWIPKPTNQKSSTENDEIIERKPPVSKVQEFDDSEALLNNMIESKIRSEEKAKEKQKRKPQVEDVSKENEVRPFTSPDEEIETETRNEDKVTPRKSEKPKEEDKYYQSPVSEPKSSPIKSEKSIEKERIKTDIVETFKGLKEEDIMEENTIDQPKSEIVNPNSIKLTIERPKNDTISESSNKLSQCESKIYHSEDDFMNSFLGEIKEESSNVTSNETPKLESKKAQDSDMKKTLKVKKKKVKVPKQDDELDPMDLLWEDYEIIDQTVDKVSSHVDESSNFQDTIIGSQYFQKLGNKGSRGKPTESRDKENKIPPLNINKAAQKFTSNNVIHTDPDNVDIDMLLSEEGELCEESIIQISESSMQKRNPVKINKEMLVKVNPMERYQEIMRNSQRSNGKESSNGKSKNKPSSYLIKPDADEESVKLDDLIKPKKAGSNKKIISGNSGKKSNGFKNIFFDVSSAKDDNEEPAVGLIDTEDYDENTIQSQRHRFTPANAKSKPIFFGGQPKLGGKLYSMNEAKKRPNDELELDDETLEDLLN